MGMDLKKQIMTLISSKAKHILFLSKEEGGVIFSSTFCLGFLEEKKIPYDKGVQMTW